jgi:hypothetical protein
MNYDNMLSNNDKHTTKNNNTIGELRMSTTKNLRLARFIKVVLDIIFGLSVFAIVALVLWMAFSPLILGQAEVMGTATVPVILGTGEEPKFEVNFKSKPDDAIRFAFVDEAEGTLRLETRSALLVVIANAAKLVVAIGLAYIFYLLRVVMQTILDGEPFAAENGLRVRRLGYAVLGIAFLGPAVQYLAATEILSRLPNAVPALNAGPTFDTAMLLGALFILLLAHIWGYGLQLERDRELTI